MSGSCGPAVAWCESYRMTVHRQYSEAFKGCLGVVTEGNFWCCAKDGRATHHGGALQVGLSDAAEAGAAQRVLVGRLHHMALPCHRPQRLLLTQVRRRRLHACILSKGCLILRQSTIVWPPSWNTDMLLDPQYRARLHLFVPLLFCASLSW